MEMNDIERSRESFHAENKLDKKTKLRMLKTNENYSIAFLKVCRKNAQLLHDFVGKCSPGATCGCNCDQSN